MTHVVLPAPTRHYIAQHRSTYLPEHRFATSRSHRCDRPLPLLRCGIDRKGLGRWRTFPPQDRTASSGGLIHALDAGSVRRLQDDERVLFNFARDLLHRIDEEIELFLRFALRRLDHERAGHDERDGYGVRGKTIVA